MRNALRPLVMAMVVVLSPAAARATTILYQLTNTDVITNTWQYDYFIGSGTFSTQQGFVVFFDEDLYSNLQLLPPSPPGWDVLLTQPDTTVDSDGTYDALALVDNPAFTGPFSVSFIWLGSVGTAPESQPFEVYVEDPLTGLFDTIETGTTTPQVVTPIPEPATALLVATGIAAARTVRRRRDRRPAIRC